jgi:hypothetical protein
MLSVLALATAVLSQCVTIEIHKEWRELTTVEQDSFLGAVKCLREKPSQLAAKFNGTDGQLPTTRWEDFVFSHDNTAPHGSPAFLPWHRAMLSMFDKAMREDCAYSGPMPYWDWSIDSEAPETSAIWDSFGRDGCVEMRVAGNLTSNYPWEHCVNRFGNLMHEGSSFSPEQVGYIMARDNYNEFREELEYTPHNMVHSSIGGDMGQVSASVNDPIFFMHHRNIDRIWAKWQQQNETFLNQYTGEVWTEDGMVSVNNTDIMTFYQLGPDMQVQDVMDTKSGKHGLLCFEYSNSITPVQPVVTKRDVSRSGAGKFNTTTPERNDRTNLFNIRVPDQVPTKFLKDWMFTDAKIAQVRQIESEIKKFTEFINKMPIVFPTSLIQHNRGKSMGWRSKTAAEAAAEDKLTRNLVQAFKNQ